MTFRSTRILHRQARNCRLQATPCCRGRTLRSLEESHYRTLAVRSIAVSAFQTIRTIPVGAPSPALEVQGFEENDDGT